MLPNSVHTLFTYKLVGLLTVIIRFAQNMLLGMLIQSLVVTVPHPRGYGEFVRRKSVGRNQRLGYIDARFSIESSHA